jgi:hypothetical protein
MRSLFVALAAASILVFGTSRASANVQNVPTECQNGLAAIGFQTGTNAQYNIVMRLWTVTFGADYHRANQFIDNVTQTVLSAQPAVPLAGNAFLGCRFIGMIDGATRAISEIATNQLLVCANEGIDIGVNLARFNCALSQLIQQPTVAAVKCYTTIDVECSVNINLGCRTGFDRYLQDHSFSICSVLAADASHASFVKNIGCNIP